MRKNKLTDRQKQAIATHQKIYKTALRLFQKEGFDRVTVDEICEKAGVSKGTFYIYFASKEQVVLDLFSMADKIYDDFLAEELAAVDNPLDKMLLLGRKALNYIKDMGIDVIQVTYRTRISFNKAVNSGAYENRSLYQIVEGLVEDALARGFIREDLTADDITRLVLRCLTGVVYDWCVAKGNFELVNEGEKAFRVLLRGLRPE